jgi:hypothetical protein
MRYYRSSWEDELAASLAGSLLGLALLLAIIAAAAVATLIFVTLKELLRVYSARAFGSDARSRQLLWASLAALLILLLVAGLLLTLHPLAALILASWSFLAFVIAIEVVDRLGPPQPAAPAPAELSVDDVLLPWGQSGFAGDLAAD